MWKCTKCGEEIEDQFDSCWKCMAPRPQPTDAKQDYPSAGAGNQRFLIDPALAKDPPTEVSGKESRLAEDYSLGDSSMTLTKEEMELFIGSNADYYLTKWGSALDETPRGIDFNWAAFFQAAFWLPYRKMYGGALILYGIMLLSVLTRNHSPGTHLGLLSGAVCGIFGNTWYLRHVRRIVRKVRSERLEGEAYQQRLEKLGGTNLLAVFGFVAAFFAVALALRSTL